MTPASERDVLALVELSVIIDETTSAIRHDLRNKLGSIRNASFYVKRRLSKIDAWTADPKLDEMTSLLEADVRVANELLAYADDRLHARSPRPTDVAACARKAVECARVAAGARIQVDCPSATMTADPSELAVAIRCLVENAAEATGADGLVQVHGRVDGDRYRLSVSDQGPGIAEAVHDLVLNPFYTTKQGHFGLGLNIAQRVARRYLGKVTIDRSAPTVVSVSLALGKASEEHGVYDPAGR